jgi:hypothetical protein
LPNCESSCQPIHPTRSCPRMKSYAWRLGGFHKYFSGLSNYFAMCRYIRLLTNVLEWQQTHEGPIQVKCEDSLFISRHSPAVSGQQSLRMRARLRRGALPSQPLPLCDRNGNNLLMIAPNNHLPFRKMNVFIDIIGRSNGKIKIEQDEVAKEKEEEREQNKEKQNSKD